MVALGHRYRDKQGNRGHEHDVGVQEGTWCEI
jgi:hypothetical protein